MNRITGNPITTIAGCVVIASSCAYVFFVQGATWTEAIVGAGFGAGLLGMKDPKFTKRDGN
jgi:hypothetical protein